MGCWSESCVITNFPIICGQKAMMIVPKSHYVGNFSSYDWNELWKKISYVGFGTYNDYGWLEEEDKEIFSIFYEPYETDPEAKKRPDFRSIFVHENVVKSILKLYPLEKSKEEIDTQIDCSIEKLMCEKYKNDVDVYEMMRPKACENLEYLLSVMKFAAETRNSLTTSLAFKGAQNVPDKKHWNLLTKMMRTQMKNYQEAIDL